MSEAPPRAASKLRLFVAATIPQGELERVAAATTALRERLTGARWTGISNQHVTLKFLGSTEEGRLREVASCVAQAAAGSTRSEIVVGGLGAFPTPRRARVLWAGIDDPAGLLARLAASLDILLEPLGWAPEQRAFTAHLTLARFKSPRPLGDLPDLQPGPPIPVDDVVLFRSRLHPKGARYEILERFPIGAPGALD